MLTRREKSRVWLAANEPEKKSQGREHYAKVRRRVAHYRLLLLHCSASLVLVRVVKPTAGVDVFAGNWSANDGCACFHGINGGGHVGVHTNRWCFGWLTIGYRLACMGRACLKRGRCRNLGDHIGRW
jgi:hypothetical protein